MSEKIPSTRAFPQEWVPGLDMREFTKVLWVAPSSRHLLTGLKKGHPSVVPAMTLQKDFARNTTEYGYLGQSRYHGRARLLPEVIALYDDPRAIFSHYTVKGSGLMTPAGRETKEESVYPMENPLQPEEGENPYFAGEYDSVPGGMFLKEDARHVWRMHEKFEKRGLRTWRPVAVVELKKLPHGKDGATSMHRKSRKHSAVAAIYGGRSTTRIAEMRRLAEDVEKAEDPAVLREAGKAEFEHAFKKLYQEAFLLGGTLGPIKTPRTFQELPPENERTVTPQQYVEFFCTELGRGLGTIHKAGYVHGSFHRGNVTLAAELVDFEDTKKATGFARIFDDDITFQDDEARMARGIILALIESMRSVGLHEAQTDHKLITDVAEAYQRFFCRGYLDAFPGGQGNLPSYLLRR